MLERKRHKRHLSDASHLLLPRSAAPAAVNGLGEWLHRGGGSNRTRSGDVGEVSGVQRPQSGAAGDRAGGDREVELPGPRTPDLAVERGGPGPPRRVRSGAARRRQRRLLVRDFGLDIAGPAATRTARGADTTIGSPSATSAVRAGADRRRPVRASTRTDVSRCVTPTWGAPTRGAPGGSGGAPGPPPIARAWAAPAGCAPARPACVSVPRRSGGQPGSRSP